MRPLNTGDAVREGDLVVTGMDSEVLIKLRDETTLALRKQSELRLTQFKFERTPDDSFLSNLLKGSVRKVSGLIAKSQQRNVRLTTPTASVGIRGTDGNPRQSSPDSSSSTGARRKRSTVSGHLCRHAIDGR